MTLTAHDRRRYAIARSREHREHELAPLVSEVDLLIARLGWPRARAVVETAMTPIRVSGPRASWRSRMGKRAGGQIIAVLTVVPAQDRLVLVSQPCRSVSEAGRCNEP